MKSIAILSKIQIKLPEARSIST